MLHVRNGCQTQIHISYQLVLSYMMFSLSKILYTKPFKGQPGMFGICASPVEFEIKQYEFEHNRTLPHNYL